MGEKKAILAGLFAIVIEFFSYLGVALVLWFAGKMVINGEINIG